MAPDARTPSDDRADSDPHTRKLRFGDRLDSGWLRPRRGEEPVESRRRRGLAGLLRRLRPRRDEEPVERGD